MLQCSREDTGIDELAYQPHAEVIIQYGRHKLTLENSLSVLSYNSLDEEISCVFL